jgi:hypothetical protein
MSVAASTFIFAPSISLFFAMNSKILLIVSGLLVELVQIGLNVGLVDSLYPVLGLTFSIATETDSSPYYRMSITFLVIASARRFFCCSVLPGHNFTIT